MELHDIYGTIYHITNLQNGKVYIGQTTETRKRMSDSHKGKTLSQQQRNKIGQSVRQHHQEKRRATSGKN